jgi:hypothetical protein
VKLEFGDRLFWGIMIFIGSLFLWIGVFETFAPLWVGAVLGFITGVLFVVLGPGRKVKSEKGARG